MRLIAVLFSLLFFALSPNVHAKAKQNNLSKEAQQMTDVSRYILTWEQISKMSPKNQVKYYRFLVSFLGTLEEMQPYPGPMGNKMKPSKSAAKSAAVETLRKMLQLIQPEAMAAGGYQQVNDASMLGKMCVYGGSPSQYTEFDTSEGKKYYCGQQGNNSCAEPMHTDCGSTSQLFKMENPLGTGAPLCVPTFPENQTGSVHGLTHRCVEALETRLGGRFNEVVNANFAKAGNNKAVKDAWNAYVEKMKDAVNKMETTNYGGTNLKDYCAKDASGNYNAMNFYKQDEECRALARLFADINGSPGIKEVIKPPAPPPVVVKGNSLYAKCHNDPTHPELGELACLNCAVRELGPQLGSSGDASKWITMLGMTAKNVQANKSGDNLKNRVIKMLLSTSYCTDAEFPNDPGFNEAQASGFPASIYKNYGMSSSRDLKNLLGDYANNDSSGFPWNFEGENIFYRRARYGYNFNRSGSHTHYSSNLKSCLRSASNRLYNNPTFNYCAANDVELNNPALQGADSADSTDLTATIAFCNNLVSACDGTDTSICTKNSLIAMSKEFNEKESRTQGEYDKTGISPRIGYESQRFVMSGNQARCPRRIRGGTSDGSASGAAASGATGATGSAGPSTGNSGQK